jgi:hypothetical protein
VANKKRTLQLIINGKDNVSRVFKRIKITLGSLKKSVFSLKTGLFGLGAAIGGKALANSFISAASEAENYRVRLNVLLGSQEEGNRLFKQMADYAAQVPYEYSEIMASATQLSGIMKGGVDEITQWMPLIGDLAAASGLGIQQTTEQVSRMLSAGAASADLFRERGITSMLGFQAGVSYSAEETRKQLWEQWSKSGSKFKGTTGEMATTWTGLTSMLKDAWFSFRTAVMDSGVFDGMKKAVQGVLDKIAELKKSGKFDELAKGFGTKIMSGLVAVLNALPSVISGAIKAAEMLILAVSGFKQIKGLFEVLLLQAQVWSLEFVNELRLVFIRLLAGLDRIPGVDTSADIKGAYSDIGATFERIDSKGGIGDKLEAAKLKLGQTQVAQDDMAAKFDEMARSASESVKTLTDGALQGLRASQAEIAAGHETITVAVNKEAAAYADLVAQYNALNNAKLTGAGTYSTVSSLSALADSLEDDDL